MDLQSYAFESPRGLPNLRWAPRGTPARAHPGACGRRDCPVWWAHMADLAFLVLTAMCFALAALFIAGCDHLK
jgi:hypothetical protein